MNILDVCLLVAIVEKGWADKIVDAAKSHGATGATIVMGRGSGRGDNQKILGLEIEPEQEVVFIVIPREIADSILNEIYETIEDGEYSKGLAFIVPIEHVIGLDLKTKEEVLPEEETTKRDYDKAEIVETLNLTSSVVERKTDEIPNIWPDDDLIPDNIRDRVGKE